MIYTCPNGELVDDAGLITGYVDYQPHLPLSEDAQTLLRVWDGVSTEALGSTPKIIAISKSDQRLLAKIRPWKWLSYASRQDYLALVDKINTHKLHLFRSILLKNRRADPDSVYNSVLYRETHKLALAQYWSLPESRIIKSIETTLAWIQRRKKYGPNGLSKQGLMNIVLSNMNREIDVWEIRRERYGSSGVKDPEAYRLALSEGQKRKWDNGYTHPEGKIWGTRRERYGPSGHNLEVKRKADKKGWETRRKRYGPTGRGPALAH